jgi:protein involved in polysaccharide export with SLBB domain
MSRTRLSAPRLVAMGGLGLVALAGCMGDPLPKQSAEFAQSSSPSWKPEDESYRFYPGDKFRIDIRTAPELSAELTVAPDGRISLPSIGPVVAAGQTIKELQSAVEDIYGNELIDPSLVITPTGFGSQKIFVGGEVKQPGVFELPGEIDTLQAIVLAGGWIEEGKAAKVVVTRRASDGQLMTRVVDLRNSMAEQQLYEIGPLRRFDVVYVTR